MTNLYSRWLRDRAGQDLIEYLLIGAFVAVLVLAGASGLGVSIDGWFSAVAGMAEDGGKKSNCSSTGMVSSSGKCDGG